MRILPASSGMLMTANTVEEGLRGTRVGFDAWKVVGFGGLCTSMASKRQRLRKQKGSSKRGDAAQRSLRLADGAAHTPPIIGIGSKMLLFPSAESRTKLNFDSPRFV